MNLHAPNDRISTLITPLLALVVGISLSAFLWSSLSDADARVRAERLRADGAAVADLIATEISQHLLALRRMRDRWELGEGTPLALWRADAASYREDIEGLGAVALFDDARHLDELAPADAPPRFALALSRVPESTFREAAVTGAVALYTYPPGSPETPDLFAVLSLRAGSDITGYLVGVFESPVLIAALLSNTDRRSRTAVATNGRSLYPMEAPPDPEMSATVPIQLNGLNWQVIASPEPARGFGVPLPTLVLAAGIIFSALLSLVLYERQAPPSGSLATMAFAASGFLTVVFLVGSASILFPALDEAQRNAARLLRSNETAAKILHLDEILTMSARMAAATADPRWEHRYREHVDDLDVAIEAARGLLPPGEDVSGLEVLDAANRSLVAIETQAFELIEQGDAPAAQRRLSGKQYLDQKTVYSETLAAFIAAVQRGPRDALERWSDEGRRLLAVWVAVAGVLVLAWLAALSLMRRNLQARRDAEAALAVSMNRLEDTNAKLAQSNRDLDAFAYIASHDLKEPLRGIRNLSSFVMEDHAEQLGSEGRNKLERITVQIDRLTALIDALLKFSRIGHAELKRSPTSLQHVVAEVLESMDSVLQEREVTVRLARDLPTVACDATLVGEVFRNLISNASKYNDTADKWLEIGWTHGDGASEDSLRRPDVFYVRDNGIGIPDKHLVSIFGIFKRLHSGDKFGGGTGAGLTIVKKIIERHKGHIWVESTPGEGTTFYFTLEEDENDRPHDDPHG